MNQFNNNVPLRLYIDGTAVYCAQSNFAPTTEIENCTTGPHAVRPLEISVGDPVIADPIVPATAEMTTGLVAPDGIVGVLPSYPGAPLGVDDRDVHREGSQLLRCRLPAGGHLWSSMTFVNMSTTLLPTSRTP